MMHKVQTTIGSLFPGIFCKVMCTMSRHAMQKLEILVHNFKTLMWVPIHFQTD